MRARFAALRDSYQQQLDALHTQVIEMDSRNERRPPPQLPPQPFLQPSRMTAPSRHHSMNAPHAFRPADAHTGAPADAGFIHFAPPSKRVNGDPHAFEPYAHAEAGLSTSGEPCPREDYSSQVRSTPDRSCAKEICRIHT